MRSTCAERSSRSSVRGSVLRGRFQKPGRSSPTATGSYRSHPLSTTAASRTALGPIPRTPLRDGIAETFRRFVALRDRGAARSLGSVASVHDLRGIAAAALGAGAAPALRPVDGAAGAGAGEEILGHRLDVDLGPLSLGVDDVFLKLVAELLEDVGLVLLEVDGFALFAVGDRDQVEAERSLDGVGNHALLELEGDVGEFLDESGREREVVEVAAGPAGVGFILRELVGRRGEGDRSAFDVFLDLRELLLGLFLLGRGRIGIDLDQDVARPKLRAAEEIAVIVDIPAQASRRSPSVLRYSCQRIRSSYSLRILSIEILF